MKIEILHEKQDYDGFIVRLKKVVNSQDEADKWIEQEKRVASEINKHFVIISITEVLEEVKV